MNDDVIHPARTVATPRIRRVVCAAIRAWDGSVLVGLRRDSPDMHAQIDARWDGDKFRQRLDENQGFVDQYGVFMTREEAYRVAEAAGQIAYPEPCGQGLDGPKLYSEGLY
jgi:hypothetical protein